MNKDSNILLLTGDLGFSVLDRINDIHSNRFFNVGIAEQAMVSIAAGLAKEGKKVVIYSIIPFLLYRPFEQILIDVCYHNASIIFVGSAEGFSYGTDAISHYALNDLSLTLQLPNMIVYAPAEPEEAANFLQEAMEAGGPAYIRLSKISGGIFSKRIEERNGLTILRRATKIAVISTGSIGFEVEKALDKLEKEKIDVGHVHVGRIKPLNFNYLRGYLSDTDLIISVEEHNKTLGFGKFLANFVDKKIEIIGVENIFEKDIGERDYILKNHRLDSEGLYLRINNMIKK